MSPLSRAAVALSPHRVWSGVVSGVGCPRLKRKLRPSHLGWCAACEAMKRCGEPANYILRCAQDAHGSHVCARARGRPQRQ
eukprot:4530869-Pyramimonas_sp.AAC.1